MTYICVLLFTDAVPVVGGFCGAVPGRGGRGGGRSPGPAPTTRARFTTVAWAIWARGGNLFPY